MNWRNFFFAVALLLASCQKEEEESLDLDELVLAEEELAAKELAGQPHSTPQEILIKESPILEDIR